MKTALLDVNVLTALLWPAHEHHHRAHKWFAARGKARWATCALTELGFVRIVSNPAFSRDALSPAAAITLLADNVGHRAHEFWTDALPLSEAVQGFGSQLQGYRQLTDSYLLALAARRMGVLATFDTGIRTLAGERMQGAVEIVAK
jgi:uncharacterized protein